LQCGDNFGDFQACDAVGRVEDANPFLRWPTPELGGRRLRNGKRQKGQEQADEEGGWRKFHDGILPWLCNCSAMRDEVSRRPCGGCEVSRNLGSKLRHSTELHGNLWSRFE